MPVRDYEAVRAVTPLVVGTFFTQR